MPVQAPGGRTEKNTTKASYHRRGKKFKVEKILNKRVVRGKKKFLV